MTDKELAALFQKQMVPLRAHVARDVATAPDATASSYYLPVLAPENIVEATPIAESLARHWAGDPQLTRLIPAIERLARELRASEDESGEVSSLIYPMY